MRSFIWINIACTLAIVAPLSEAVCGENNRTNCTLHTECGAKEACMTPQNGLSQCYACPCNEKSQCEFIPNKGRQWQCNCGSSGFSGRVCDCPPIPPLGCSAFVDSFLTLPYAHFYHQETSRANYETDETACENICKDDADCALFSYFDYNCTIYGRETMAHLGRLTPVANGDYRLHLRVCAP